MSHKLSRIREVERRHSRGYSTDIVINRLYDAAALLALVFTSLNSVPRPRNRAKKIESKPRGGSCEAMLLYAKQPFTGKYPTDVPLPVPNIRRTTFTLKDERWRRIRKKGLVLSATVPRNLLCLQIVQAEERKHASEWMRFARIQVACVHTVAAATEI